MANVQRQFETFHNRIKPGFFKGEQPLREKRDRLWERLQRELPEIAQDAAEILSLRIQGSYQTRTTVTKVKGEIDIDVGLYLDVDIGRLGPVEVKRWVYEALEGHTQEVDFRRHCIRVKYQRGFHVDLAVYAAGKSNGGDCYLAVGKRHSENGHKEWEQSNPRKLHDLIIDNFDEDERRQLRRTVRYLKRWSELHFRQRGDAAPTGIALTTAAYHYFDPKGLGVFRNGEPNDLEALRDLTQDLLDAFNGDEIEVRFPAAPHDDLFGEMTSIQQKNFKHELQKLHRVLGDASCSSSQTEACALLSEVFTEDFTDGNEKLQLEDEESRGSEIDSVLSGSAVAFGVGLIVKGLVQKFVDRKQDLQLWPQRNRREIMQVVRSMGTVVLMIGVGWLIWSAFSD
ncbi:cyclic GMP-AMP synthase DncV-like nucleotidyltransferase [Salinibacter ruber]|uniref:cyclic GMP-AMP synthase DncV-like nucleotidyltransferase n=1 Tax=Salinibacter ruber TaxID=146919 RepID=UPI0021684002|nr:hypothetical protein [Salinibacter ruber]MCS3665318.1 hypothetical protein [Salinibacter ruber]MCS3756020.1 hypothetical protein [Salinibacter ruber]